MLLNQALCLWCGTVIALPRTGRPRRTCEDDCRQQVSRWRRGIKRRRRREGESERTPHPDSPLWDERAEARARRLVGARSPDYFAGRDARLAGAPVERVMPSDWREGYQDADDLIAAGVVVPA